MTPPGIYIGKQKFASRGSIKNIVQMPQGLISYFPSLVLSFNELCRHDQSRDAAMSLSSLLVYSLDNDSCRLVRHGFIRTSGDYY
jgi:hypothetical protein